MVLEVIQWRIEPARVTGDSWYSSLENLKFLRNEKVGFLFGIASNRKFSVTRGTSVSVKDVDIPEDGLMVYLKAFAWVRVYCPPFKNEPRYYILYQPELALSNSLLTMTSRLLMMTIGRLSAFTELSSKCATLSGSTSEMNRPFAITFSALCALSASCRRCVLRPHQQLLRDIETVIRARHSPVHPGKSERCYVRLILSAYLSLTV